MKIDFIKLSLGNPNIDFFLSNQHQKLTSSRLGAWRRRLILLK